MRHKGNSYGVVVGLCYRLYETFSLEWPDGPVGVWARLNETQNLCGNSHLSSGISTVLKIFFFEWVSIRVVRKLLEQLAIHFTSR